MVNASPFEYSSDSRAIVRFDRRPQQLEIDGATSPRLYRRQRLRRSAAAGQPQGFGSVTRHESSPQSGASAASAAARRHAARTPPIGLGREGERAPGQFGDAGLAAPASVSSGEADDQGDSVSSDSVAVSGPAAVLSQVLEQHAQRLQSLSAAVRGGAYEPTGSAIGQAIAAQAVS